LSVPVVANWRLDERGTLGYLNTVQLGRKCPVSVQTAGAYEEY